MTVSRFCAPYLCMSGHIRTMSEVCLMEYADFLKSKLDRSQLSGLDIPIESLNDKLFPFQKDIVSWCLKAGKSAIFAACGLGKTPMQLEWAHQVNKATDGDILILAPLAVTNQTKKEGAKFGIEVNICRSQFDVKPGINITNYEMVDNFQINRFIGVVLDESSILKNLMGKFRTKIIDIFSQTSFKLCCTATPAPNDYTEIGNHSEFLNISRYNEMLSKYFINDSARTTTWRLKAHAVKPFWEWVSSWAVCLNKPSDMGYDDTGFDLPPLNWIEDIVQVDISGFHQGTLFANTNISSTDLFKNLRSTIEPRAQRIAKIVGDSKEPWLIWVNTNYEADILRKALPQAVDLRGSESHEDKERKLNGFVNGDIKILLTKASIAGFGLNFQHCHNMAFVGINYSFESAYQAIRRCWRYQQQHPVNVHVILAETEVGILDSVKKKAEAHQNMEKQMIKLAKFEPHKEKRLTVRQAKQYTGKNWTLINGDSVVEIKNLADESIDFSVFSPPFSSIFVYSDNHDDMGNSTSDEQFFKHFSFMIPDLLRVTKPGRLCAVHCSVLPQFKFKDGEIGLKDFRGDIIRLFIEHGWIFHSETCIWKCPVTEMTRTKALGLLHKQIKKDSSMCRMGLPDYLVVFRKPGENQEPIIHTPEDYPVDEWQKVASPVWMDIKQSNTLNTKFAKGDRDEKHICPLQLGVIERALKLWSNPGDLVLSPFAGIGSEGYQSLKMGRRFVGIELKPEYCKEAVRYLTESESQKELF